MSRFNRTAMPTHDPLRSGSGSVFLYHSVDKRSFVCIFRTQSGNVLTAPVAPLRQTDKWTYLLVFLHVPGHILQKALGVDSHRRVHIGELLARH